MMRLAHPALHFVIPFEENQIPLLTVEEPALFRKLVWEMTAQTQGQEGSFVLSDDWVPMALLNWLNKLFESDVVLEGTQTTSLAPRLVSMFESDVAQTIHHQFIRYFVFESDVVLEGTQTQVPPARRIAPFESDVVLEGTQTSDPVGCKRCPFESDVVLEGTQTENISIALVRLFESDVVLEGTQTKAIAVVAEHEFESDVVLEGTQTSP